MKPVVAIQPPGMLAEFTQFVTKTNAIALAIGVIIGTAATKLVTSIVENILNPLLGAVLGGVNLNDALKIGPLGTSLVDGKEVGNYIRLGAVISSTIDFVAVMLVIFIIIKLVAREMLEDKP